MTFRLPLYASAIALAVAAAACPTDVPAASRTPVTAQDIASLVQPQAAQAVSVSVFATGLYNPRGLKFGPDGDLYVAEGGKGGTGSTIGTCKQVVAPIGPYTGSRTGGRISRISPTGVRTTVTTQLPSSQTSADSGSFVSGVADIAFVGRQLYALTAGGGCSHGVLGRPNAVVSIGPRGVPTMIANLSTYQKTHPVQHPEADDFEPDGTWYSMVAVGSYLYALEPNHGELVRVSTLTGAIKRVSDISASQGHIVPTALTTHFGNFFVGNLNTFPIVDGSSKILKITPAGYLTTVVRGVTTVLGVQFDRLGRMYVLQTTTDNPLPTPGAGSIVRISANGAMETIVTGLSLPTAMTFGPGGDLFVSNVGFGAPPKGVGQVLRIHLGS
jgi:hypothetical protein